MENKNRAGYLGAHLYEVAHLCGELLCDLLLAAHLDVVCGLGATIDYYYYYYRCWSSGSSGTLGTLGVACYKEMRRNAHNLCCEGAEPSPVDEITWYIEGP